MSTINLPAFSQFKKESIEYDVGYDTYTDTAYVYKIRDVSFVIRHVEEKYGHDTWGWTVEVCTPYKTYYVGSKILSLQTGYCLLEKYVCGKRLATKEDRRLLKQLEQKTKDAAKAYFDFDAKNRITECRTSEYIGCKNCGSKLFRKYLTGNYCPLCKNDLRSATVIERLKKLNERKTEYQNQLNMLENGKVLY